MTNNVRPDAAPGVDGQDKKNAKKHSEVRTLAITGGVGYVIGMLNVTFGVVLIAKETYLLGLADVLIGFGIMLLSEKLIRRAGKKLAQKPGQ